MDKFSILFRTLYRPLCLYAMHYLHGNIEEAEDVVQDCFVKYLNQGAENPKAFLYTLVRNRCVDLLRHRSPVDAQIEPCDLEGVISDVEAQERSFTEARLWTAIDHLPPRQRQVLLMSKRGGLRYIDIAQQLGISPKTVEHLISHALSTLRGKREEILFVLLA